MARDEEDERATPRSAGSQWPPPKDLTPFSIAELEHYVIALQAEIARIREAVMTKEKHRGGAESLFKR